MQDELELVQEVYNVVINFMVNYSFQLVGAVIILITGLIVASWVSRLLMRIQEKRNVAVTLRLFISSAVRIMVIGLFGIIALGKLGNRNWLSRVFTYSQLFHPVAQGQP